jgi:ankyrin repeat protein
MNGHFDIVKYLVEVVGAKYSHHAIEWALENGHQEIADYLT